MSDEQLSGTLVRLCEASERVVSEMIDDDHVSDDAVDALTVALDNARDRLTEYRSIPNPEGTSDHRIGASHSPMTAAVEDCDVSPAPREIPNASRVNKRRPNNPERT